MKGPIATFLTANAAAMMSMLASADGDSLLSALLPEQDMPDLKPEDVTARVTFRAKDVATVTHGEGFPPEARTALAEKGLEINSIFGVNLNPETTGRQETLLVINSSYEDFLIWWNQYGS